MTVRLSKSPSDLVVLYRAFHDILLVTRKKDSKVVASKVFTHVVDLEASISFTMGGEKLTTLAYRPHSVVSTPSVVMKDDVYAQSREIEEPTNVDRNGQMLQSTHHPTTITIGEQQNLAGITKTQLASFQQNEIVGASGKAVRLSRRKEIGENVSAPFEETGNGPFMGSPHDEMKDGVPNLYPDTEELQPGFEFVPWGDYGPPTRVPQEGSQQFQDELVSSETNNSEAGVVVVDGDLIASESMQSRKVFFVRNRRVWCVGLLLMILAIGVVVVGICVFGSNSSSATAGQGVTTPMDPPTFSCDNWFNHTQPSVITQCFCYGKITIVADDVAANYQRLQTGGFIEGVLPGFNDTISSCDPANQALVWLASATGSPSPDVDLRQRFVMALLYVLWNGRLWTVNTGWLSSDNECIWDGVTCDRFGVVTGINLYNNQLTGDLGSEFTLLTSLAGLSLGGNGLQGSLPSELGKLVGLTSLTLQSNQLTGPLPEELSQLTLLVELMLGDNTLVGTIPTSLGELLILETLSLSNNTFTSRPIPTEIGLLTNLQTLQLNQVGLKGTLPTEIFNLGATMQVLDVGSNSLTGTIPYLVGNLAAASTLR